ncbi:MAG: hypothetical protein J7M14_03765 [Planctomycetes bacterium]|nr:hypothetical protein [Planctomycetota bacterium]
MSRHRHPSRTSAGKSMANAPVQAVPPEPVDVVDGIPDRTSRPVLWKYLLLGVIFAVWVAFLVFCQIAGAPPK